MRDCTLSMDCRCFTFVNVCRGSDTTAKLYFMCIVLFVFREENIGMISLLKIACQSHGKEKRVHDHFHATSSAFL